MKAKVIIIVLALVLLGVSGFLWFKIDGKNTQIELLNSKLEGVQNKLDQAQREKTKLEDTYKKQIDDLKAQGEIAQTQIEAKLKFSSEIISRGPADYKTVKLTNGETYYGVIKNYSGGVVTLNDIFYIQGFLDFDKASTTMSSFSLIKKGSEPDAISGDQLSINDSSIVSIATLSPASKIYQAIGEYKKYSPGQPAQ